MRHTIPPPAPKPRKKTTLLELVLFALFGLMLIIGGMALYSQISPSYEKVPSTLADGFRRDRVNILVIGIGGDTHPGEGKELADALMLVSLKPSTKQAALVSIPRDYYVKASRYGAHRINAAHDIGNNSGYPGRGPGLVSDEVTQITGQPIDAFVRIDFKAFEKLIDSLGGVDIFVYRPFHDRLFKQTFQGGWQHMDGKRALAFARYRHIQGSEGTGYARELRQQQIASAVRSKLRNASSGQILRLLADLRSISRHTTTNLTSGEIAQLYRAFHDMDQAKIRHVSLAPVTEVYGDGFTVRPLDPSGKAIRGTLQTVFNDTKPIANPDQIQIVEGVTPKPSKIAGDDTMMDPTALESQSRTVAQSQSGLR